jgi:hypothetical protein
MIDEQRNLQLHRMRLVYQTTELVAAAFPAAVVALGALRLQTYLLKQYADREIADRYLEPLLSGELYGSFGVTEPDAGTDVRAISTVATRDRRLDPQRRQEMDRPRPLRCVQRGAGAGDAASYGCGFIKAAIRECSVRANTWTAFGHL